MTPLSDILLQKIKATGPMTVADYMTECLLHPQHGYYSTRDPFGSAGDFTTAPEISQMFGEMLGLLLAQCWIDQGSPAQFALLELGPGRGTLTADILRATQHVPGFHQAARLHLVEASDALREVQKTTLQAHNPIWHKDTTNLPDLPLFLIANEFFDALPVRQFQREGSAWREVSVGLTDNELSFGLSEPVKTAILSGRLADTKDGDIVELNNASVAIMQNIASKIAENGGVALIVDYGDWRSLGDTFQAVQNHEKVHPLHQPGQSDLTAHVDFEQLKNAAIGVSATHMIPQGVLLERLGITARAKKLAEKLNDSRLEVHIEAHRRLTHPQEMGTLFKAIAFYHKRAPAPPGFENDT